MTDNTRNTLSVIDVSRIRDMVKAAVDAELERMRREHVIQRLERGEYNMPKFGNIDMVYGIRMKWGTDVEGWLDECEQVFSANNVSDERKVSIISHYLLYSVSVWHEHFLRVMGEKVDWISYKKAILRRFGNSRDDASRTVSGSKRIVDSRLQSRLVDRKDLLVNMEQSEGAHNMFDQMSSRVSDKASIDEGNRLVEDVVVETKKEPVEESVEVVDGSGAESVEDTSVVGNVSDCVMGLDDGCQETESRVCGIDDDMMSETNKSLDSEWMVMEDDEFQDFEDVKMDQGREQGKNLQKGTGNLSSLDEMSGNCFGWGTFDRWKWRRKRKASYINFGKSKGRWRKCEVWKSNKRKTTGCIQRNFKYRKREIDMLKRLKKKQEMTDSQVLTAHKMVEKGVKMVEYGLSNLDSGYDRCVNRGMSNITWKPMVKMRRNGSIMVGNYRLSGITRGGEVTDEKKMSDNILGRRVSLYQPSDDLCSDKSNPLEDLLVVRLEVIMNAEYGQSHIQVRKNTLCKIPVCAIGTTLHDYVHMVAKCTGEFMVKTKQVFDPGGKQAFDLSDSELTEVEECVIWLVLGVVSAYKYVVRFKIGKGVKENELVSAKVSDQCTHTQNMWFWGFGLFAMAQMDSVCESMLIRNQYKEFYQEMMRSTKFCYFHWSCQVVIQVECNADKLKCANFWVHNHDSTNFNAMLSSFEMSVSQEMGDGSKCFINQPVIRKRGFLSNMIFGDDDMNFSFHQNINLYSAGMGVNEFVGGANGSAGNLVSRSNSGFLDYKYERNIYEVEDKRGIGSDACKFAISNLNCIDQCGLISSGMYTLVMVWNLATEEKVKTLKGRKMQATCVTWDISDGVSAIIDCTIIHWEGDEHVRYQNGTSDTSSQPNTPYGYSSYDHNCATVSTKKKSTGVRFDIWKWPTRKKYIEEGAGIHGL